MEIFKKLMKMAEGQNRRKLVENTAIVIIAGIIIIIAGSTIFSGDKTGKAAETARKEASQGNTYLSQETAEDIGESKLKSILSQIEGVGKADVMITYYSTKEDVPAYDISKNQSSTREKDSAGGTRDTDQEEYNSTMTYEDSSEGKKPVILKSIEPQVKGVLVVADGAGSVEVRERICNAVTVVLDIPPHRVEVIPRKR